MESLRMLQLQGEEVPVIPVSWCSHFCLNPQGARIPLSPVRHLLAAPAFHSAPHMPEDDGFEKLARGQCRSQA